MQHTRSKAAGAIAAPRPSALACCQLVCLNPITLAASFLVAVVVGTSSGAIAAALAVVAAGAVLMAVSPLPAIRRLVAPVLARKARRDRHELLERQLERAGSSRRSELDELTALVEEVAERDPDECERLELEELVDLYVEMAILAESYRNAARRSTGLAGDGDAYLFQRTPAAGARLRRDLVRRRIAHRDECNRKVAELEAELDAVVEFVRLVAQRAACPAGREPLEPQLERRVWELDARDTAMRQLAAGDGQ
ncbi:MAG TPA: hypothetical protein VFU21_18400 [Kofleriaceae bacterium]|nr:hypothetical protein [Kofleriaceae bacterium]